MRSIAALLLLTTLASCSTEPSAPPSDPAKETYAASLAVDLSKMAELTPDLYLQDKVVGSGATAATGQTIGVTYTGCFVNGNQFDTNVGKPAFSFILAYDNVIEGWHKGLVGMKVGGTRRLIIGSALGYGAAGKDAVPRNTTLVCEVALLSVN